MFSQLVNNNKPKANQMKKNEKQAVKQAGRGRPTSKVSVPSGRFTMEKAFELNGCNLPDPRVCKMTVIKHITANAKGKNSIIVNTGELVAAPSGKGRKRFVYLRRAQQDNGKRVANLNKAKTSDVTVDVAIPIAELPVVELAV